MFSVLMDNFDKLGEVILKLTVPHRVNNHRPHCLRSYGLTVLLAVLLFGQTVANLTTGRARVLGYATNISVAEIIRLTNNERSSAGLPSLVENQLLNKAAALKAEDMFAKDYWAHFGPDGTSPWYFFGLVGYSYSWAGENLARDFATSGGVVAAWMASSGHRANILNPNFSEIGVAVVNGNLEGEDTTLVVQLFGRPTALATASQTGQAKPSSTPIGQLETKVVIPPTATAGASNKVVQKTGREQIQPSSGQKQELIGLIKASLVKSLTPSQKVTLTLLVFLGVLLLTDSVIIFRKRHYRSGSHSFAHASMVLLLIVLTLLYGQGTIL